MTSIQESEAINGVFSVNLKAFADNRGRFTETFRKTWFPQRSWDNIQTNRSDSHKGVLRGLHYHRHQVDYWYVPYGQLRVGLADLRPDSPTYLATELVEMGEENEIGLFIPSEVAHGFYALTDVTLTYIVDNYYNPADELGVHWNDPDLNLAWGTTNPIVSERDDQNPFLRDIPR
ncbi:MAG: dTDP-4-dehydrorhamnose 3,5-epimerase [Chloroflexota bacterium]